MFFRLTASGNGELVASKTHLLYAFFCRVNEDWLDENVSSFPKVALYEGYGFYTLRPWVRPFVPNIEKISEKERAYYDGKFTSFHDLDSDWQASFTEGARHFIDSILGKVKPELSFEEGLEAQRMTLAVTQSGKEGRVVFLDKVGVTAESVE